MLIKKKLKKSQKKVTTLKNEEAEEEVTNPEDEEEDNDEEETEEELAEKKQIVKEIAKEPKSTEKVIDEEIQLLQNNGIFRVELLHRLNSISENLHILNSLLHKTLKEDNE